MSYTVTAVGERVIRSSRPEHPWARGLPEGYIIEDRGPLGVFVVHEATTIGIDKKPHTVRHDTRVDSRQDADVRKAGGVVWFDALLAKGSKK